MIEIGFQQPDGKLADPELPSKKLVVGFGVTWCKEGGGDYPRSLESQRTRNPKGITIDARNYVHC
jgi:hypothetical protein